MATRAVFLDFGGTLVSSDLGVFAAFEAAYEAVGLALAPTTFERAAAEVAASAGDFEEVYLGQPPGFADQYHALVVERIGGAGATGRILAALHEVTTSPQRHIPFPETAEVLTELDRRGFSLHLVSNNTEHLHETLRRLGWERRFRSVTYSQEAGAVKPDPRIFQLALQRAGCLPGEAVHAGDSWEADVLGARGAGMAGVWVDRAGKGPKSHCPRIPDLRGLLEHLGTRPDPASGTEALDRPTRIARASRR
ncbi:MAG: HAD family hydrolase [Thermoplasmata archaeon]|nr:HAD family hydrolase [Thermoplasmata archaeon]